MAMEINHRHFEAIPFQGLFRAIRKNENNPFIPVQPFQEAYTEDALNTKIREFCKTFNDRPERMEAIEALEANKIAFEAAWKITVAGWDAKKLQQEKEVVETPIDLTEMQSDLNAIADLGREMSKTDPGYFTLTRQGKRPATVGSIIRQNNNDKEVDFYVVGNTVSYYDHDRLCDFDMDGRFEPGYITEVSVILLKKKQQEI